MSQLRLFKNSAIYSFVSILQKAVGFILLPLYTAYLSPNDYGILSVISSITNLFSVLMMLSLYSASSRYHYQNSENQDKIARIWGSNLTIVILNSLILGIVLTIFHKYLIDPLIENIKFFPFVFVGIIATVFTPVYTFFQFYLQTIQNAKTYGINLFFNFLLNVGLTIFFITHLKLGVLGVLYANLLTSIIFFIYTVILFIPKIRLGFDGEIIKKSCKYSFPLVPHSLSGWLSGMLDRLFLNNMANTAQVGIYSIGYQFGYIINVLSSSFNQAYVPWFYETIEKGQENISKLLQLVEVVLIFISLVGFGFSLFSREILMVMVSEKFWESWKFIPLLCFGNVFGGFYYFFVNVLFLEKTKYVPFVTVSMAIIGLLINILLIPKFGYWGASISFFITNFLTSLMILFFALRVRPDVNFKWKRYYFISLFLFLISIFSIFILKFTIVLNFIIKLTIFITILLIFSLKYKHYIVGLYNLFKMKISQLSIIK